MNILNRQKLNHTQYHHPTRGMDLDNTMTLERNDNDTEKYRKLITEQYKS